MPSLLLGSCRLVGGCAGSALGDRHVRCRGVIGGLGLVDRLGLGGARSDDGLGIGGVALVERRLADRRAGRLRDVALVERRLADRRAGRRGGAGGDAGVALGLGGGRLAAGLGLGGGELGLLVGVALRRHGRGLRVAPGGDVAALL